MEELFGGVFYLILNFIGGVIRWIYGSIWRSIFNKPKFKFREYLFGVDKDSDYYDDLAHGMNNVLIGIVFIIIIASLIIKNNL